MEWAGSLSYIFYSIGAVASGLAALWIVRNGAKDRLDLWAGVVALALTANWCVAAASFHSNQPIVGMTEIASNLAWIFVLFRLFANDGRDESVRLVRPAALALGFVELLQFALLAIVQGNPGSSEIAALALQTSAIFRMLVAICALVLLHNLYVGAAPSSRRILRWGAAAMAGMWAFTLNFYTIAYLAGSYADALVASRGLAAAIVAIPFAIGFNRAAAGLTFSPSRAVTFRFLSLLVIGGYLAGMLTLANWLDIFTGNAARLTQVGLVIAAGALALIWLPSDHLRGWLRVTAIKHLFKHRYDYRNEWIRFTHTIGRSGLDEASLQERVVKAMADITDSPSGALLLAGEEGRLVFGGHWRWPQLAVPANPVPCELVTIFEREGLILAFDEARAGIEHQGELQHVPEWLLDEPRAWAAVPLLHYDRLVGIIVLARPLVERRLDWEDFDLLGIVGQQLASYLSEQAGQEALSEAARFDEFNRRMAFVMHDIKNLSSQMSLLLRNAEKHADKPEFRKDMLVTLRNSADKLNTMLARLGRYGTGAQEDLRAFDMASIVRGSVDRFARSHTVTLVRSEPLVVNGQPDAFEQALVHIVQNAIDASSEGNAVMLEAYSDGVCGVVQVLDSGKGMGPAFLRNGLFKPFVSSKEGGFGIGAYEARELVRSMGGRLDVESREGLGTRFTISLPLEAARRIITGSRPDAKTELA
ncbi:XrtA/PEP-CTERM system histidine kinase PrsK [Erythrobacter sp. SD-21]|uniref:XrtA/PEP-CTERM system histidine kinase PrsK n=1 Tax=Erythrobacter sp. SD-21 TaxID=161528 RepID=UPI000153FA3A|nr:XrtA/PEP-CTERM system histidine kinase PrsK [Erythrobacter sp. SD-21]EDL50611.1 multi-sensor signal transduction histidine kinase [Erythrobacter sp. SD-21]